MPLYEFKRAHDMLDPREEDELKLIYFSIGAC